MLPWGACVALSKVHFVDRRIKSGFHVTPPRPSPHTHTHTLVELSYYTVRTVHVLSRDLAAVLMINAPPQLKYVPPSLPLHRPVRYFQVKAANSTTSSKASRTSKCQHWDINDFILLFLSFDKRQNVKMPPFL